MIQRISLFFARINWWRLASPAGLGILLNVVMNLIFGLLYPYSPANVEDKNNTLAAYFWVILLTFLVMVGLRTINDHLDKRMAWNANPVRRLIVQQLMDISYILFCVSVVRNLFNWYCVGQTFISLRDEIVVAAVSVTLTMIVVGIDMGVFLLKRWRDSVSELERFKKENIEFQFEMLKNQVNPHFLFNSLNTLSSLIFADQETAAQFVRQLAKVYRYVLENRDKELITMAEEMMFLASYRYLVEMRFAPNLHFDVDIPDSYKNAQIMPMTLQMLIENAIKHNILSQKKPLTIHLRVTEDHFLEVINNLQPKSTKEYSSGLGLKNITNRYAYLTDRPVCVSQSREEFRVLVPLICY
ncbi:sensor histidine kinase [Flexibacter flexilis]|nr:histidine kinase [Flexibacter flexilis]